MPIYGYPGGGAKLKEAGAIFADNLSPQKARILLMLALQTTSYPREIQKLFDKYRGIRPFPSNSGPYVRDCCDSQNSGSESCRRPSQPHS
jgi:hypothetical protein